MIDKAKEISKKSSLPAMEEEILDFWEKNKIFKKSLEKGKKDYVFYDGPPFGTGEPHYGHILSSVSKDVVPRYFTMKGFRVERKWGWDCHGLPIENIIEKDLGINGKKEIEEIGVGKFNEACRARVLEYADVWDKMVRRIGRWVDFKNSYKTMDLTFMESVWWGFKELWDKGLVYEGRKVLLYCPRCETPISNFEVAMDNSYKDITEKSVYVKFKIKNAKEKLSINGDVYILAWTTTPWTLPGNVALAVGEDIDYVIAGIKNQELGSRENILLAKNRLKDVLSDFEYEIIKEFKGKKLVGLEYEPLFDLEAIKETKKKAYYVAGADFVTTEDGTGIVHTAVVYGEDDYNLGIKLDLPVVPALDNKGHFNETVPQFTGVYFLKANKLVIEDLEKRGLLFKTEDHLHSYPHCHRCDTQLFYNAIPAWFIAIQKLKKKMLKSNEKINWYPEHLKEGRFAKGLEQAPDWNISRNRFFATPMPIWKCSACGEIEVIGGVEELKKKSGASEIKDIHSHFINDLVWPCPKCKGEMKRITEVFDCWVESGSMPFAQMHYPFENKKKFEDNFPAQFISEYISQTRAWFYVMHVMSTALFGSNSYENVVATGVILNDKGEKMSKSKKNYPDPWKVLDQYGADPLRYYLCASPVMKADNINFSEKDLAEQARFFNILLNVLSFYKMFAVDAKIENLDKKDLVNVLDKWIMARLEETKKIITEKMDNYDLQAIREIPIFINDLSTWYVRRSRERFKGEDEVDKMRALKTLRRALYHLARIMAPFLPFTAEHIYQELGADVESVHLKEWPEVRKEWIDKKVLEEMEAVRKIVELGLAERDKAGIKVRQALSELRITNYELREEYVDLLKDELNVKEIKFVDGKELAVEFDTTMTPELIADGIKRELVRAINNARKEASMTIQDKAAVYYETASQEIKDVFEKFGEEIKKDTLSDEIVEGGGGKAVKINEGEVNLKVEKK
jgi:isoleucyl-tRNA synthetase